MTISGGSSALLDSLRILAAFTVVADHACQQWLTADNIVLEQFDNIAHAAVVVFFVLSGYLIAYTTTSNNRGPRQYAVARLSRLYSVVLPALLLTGLIEIAVTHLDPALAAHYARGSSWPRYVLSLFFCNEVGWASAGPPINSPLWSLSFEFWYYAIFGLWFYRGTGWKSLLLPIGACVVAGPKILVLIPIWLFGFLACRLPTPSFSTSKSWISVFTLLAVTGFAISYLPAAPYPLVFKPLFFANRFVADWVIGIIFSLALWFLPAEGHFLKSEWVKLLRITADLSFPLYVLHYPLLVLWRAIFGWQANNTLQMWQVAVVVSFLAILIGIFLENQRNNWVRFFWWAANHINLQRVLLTENMFKA